MKKRILFIDDCDPSMPFIVERLMKMGFEVRISESVYSTLSFGKENNGLGYFDFIIINPVMGPFGQFSMEETKNGQNTGWCLYHKMRMNLLKKTKVIIWAFNLNNYSNLKWDDNVSFFKRGEGDELLVSHVLKN